MHKFVPLIAAGSGWVDMVQDGDLATDEWTWCCQKLLLVVSFQFLRHSYANTNQPRLGQIGRSDVSDVSIKKGPTVVEGTTNPVKRQL